MRRLYTYLAFVFLAIGLFFFFKINKTSFYHHYFRVIAEVENRNSTQLDETSILFYTVEGGIGQEVAKSFALDAPTWKLFDGVGVGIRSGLLLGESLLGLDRDYTGFRGAVYSSLGYYILYFPSRAP